MRTENTMATQEMDRVRALDPQQQAVLLAFAVLMDRLNKLSKDDSDAVFELFKDWHEAVNDEEKTAAQAAIMEMLDGRSEKVERLNLSAPSRSSRLQKWRVFVSTRIRDERTAAELTQQQLAEATGLPQSHISRIENAQLSPSQVTLEKIAKALGLDARTFDPSAEED